MRVQVVRGGWEGHRPIDATDLFLPFLERSGYQIQINDTPGVYADPVAMARTDLIVQCVSMGEITGEQVAGLRAAVAAGTGLTGWHGGIVDSYRASTDYLQLVGGQFVTHPGPPGGTPFVPHTIDLTPAARTHPITAGLDDFALETEQYWVLHDELNDVLATTTHPAPSWQPWHRPVTCPAIWTRRWGTGRVVVSTPGHSLDVLEHPSVRTIIERGMVWATRTASAS